MATSDNIIEQISIDILDFLINNVFDDIMRDDTDLPQDDWVKASQVITNQELNTTKYYHTIIDALEPIPPDFKCNDISCGPKELIASFHEFVTLVKLDLKGKEYTDEQCILVDTMGRVLCDLALYCKKAHIGMTKEDLKIIGPRIYCTIRKLQNFKQGEIFPKYSDTYQDKLSTWVKELPGERAVLLVHYIDGKTYVSLPIGTKGKLKKTKEDEPEQYFTHFRAYRL